jgi:hypothetical protein
MRKHLLPALLAALTFSAAYGLPASAADAQVPADSGYDVINTIQGDMRESPAPKKKPVEEPPKKTKYDQLPLNQLLEKANTDDLIAQFELASRYNYGRGIPRDTAQALRWLRKAAKAGQPDAQKLLAIKLYNGYGIEPNYKEALKWAEKLAENGDVAAAIMIGNMYATGEAGKRNLPRAYTWYAIGASGEKIPEDNPSITEEQLQQNSQVLKAEEERDKIAGLISAREETKAQKDASAWWLKHIDNITKVKEAKAKKKAEEEAELLAAEEAAKRAKRRQ